MLVFFFFFLIGKSTEKVYIKRRGSLMANSKHIGKIQQAPKTTDKRAGIKKPNPPSSRAQLMKKID